MSEQYAELPAEVIVDPEAKEVVITPEVEAALPGVSGIFADADRAFDENPRQYLQEMEDSLFSFPKDLDGGPFSFLSSRRANIECSLIPGNGNEAFVMWAPFSDGPPQSSAEQMFNYTQAGEVGVADKVFAKPNSWNQLTKSAVMAEVLRAAGVEMPVLTIFSPLPSVPYNAYSHEEYKQIRQGDFRPSARIVEEALAVAQDKLHGPRSETQIDTVHMHGASLGASSAIGAAAGIVWNGGKDIKSVTAQELIIAPKNVVPDLAKRFTIGDPVGEASTLRVSDHYPRLAEPLLRRLIDKAGNEPAMFAHMLRGMSKLSRLKGLTGGDDNRTVENIEFLDGNGVPVMIPLAETSGLTHDTPDHLPHGGEKIVSLRATEGRRTSHLVDEHVGVTTLLAVAHVAQAGR